MEFANTTVTRDVPFDVNSMGADVLIGASGEAGVFSEKIVKGLGRDPIIFALSGPNPEILPNLAKKYRSDCLIATSRSDLPN